MLILNIYNKQMHTDYIYVCVNNQNQKQFENQRIFYCSVAVMRFLKRVLKLFYRIGLAWHLVKTIKSTKALR